MIAKSHVRKTVNVKLLNTMMIRRLASNGKKKLMLLRKLKMMVPHVF